MHVSPHRDTGEIALRSYDGKTTMILGWFEAERLMRSIETALREAAPAVRPAVARRVEEAQPGTSVYREARGDLDRVDLLLARSA